jgi:BirA family biotin operon repressor/biotin-[acetyl-CoA-carboxylase] ligase
VRYLLQTSGFHSGEELADVFGVSRAALQKWIVKLRDGGFVIKARPSRGYHLVETPDRLIAETILPHLQTRWIGNTLRAFGSVASTNEALITAAVKNAVHGTVVVAESQTQGRGRLHRLWHSPPQKNIYLSVLLRPPIPPHRAPLLTLATAVAVAEAIETHCAVTTQLKWPNDLLYNGKKLCGILTEISGDSDRVSWIVVGIGINVNMQSTDLPSDLKDRATSLKTATGRNVNRAVLTVRVLERLEWWYERYLERGAETVLHGWKTRPNMLGRSVRISPPGPAATPLEGTAIDLDDDGALILQIPDGHRERILAGDLAEKRPTP